MTFKKIIVILGHPARARKSFCEALAESYIEGAKEVGHTIDFIKISDLSFDPILHEGYKGEQAAEPDILDARSKMLEADHFVIVYPLWQFSVPALLKGFCERTLTLGFAYDLQGKNPVLPLQGKSVRLIQTMGMPGFAYRWIFREYGEKTFKAMLRFIGMKPVRVTYCGLAESLDESRRSRYLMDVKRLGLRGL